MKEAAGEANLSVITIILMGMIIPVFLMVIPRILSGIKDKACCVSNNGTIIRTNLQTNCRVVVGKVKSGYSYIDKTKSESINGFNRYCK